MFKSKTGGTTLTTLWLFCKKGEDFEHTWSCYEGGEEPCGKCGTCIDRKAALEANGLKNC